MAIPDSTLRPAGSPVSTSTSKGEPLVFDDLLRRLHVEVCRVQLVASHFGDLSGLSGEDAPAGLVLYEASRALDSLHNDMDRWRVRSQPTAPEVIGGDTSDGPGDRTEGQRLYDKVAEAERDLKGLMDSIPYESLGDLPESDPIAQALLNVEIHLQDAVAELRRYGTRSC